MEHAAIDVLRERHAAWRLLRAGNASLILSFLGRFFVEGNRGATAAGEVAAALDDDLYTLNAALTTDSGEPRFPKQPKAYLEDWSATEIGYLRRFYPVGVDEVHYEATPAFEKAYAWWRACDRAPSSAPSRGCTPPSSCCGRSCTVRDRSRVPAHRAASQT